MSVATRSSGLELRPFECLFEASGLPGFDLPDELAEAYGGSLGLAETSLYANFVSSLDGVTALPQIQQSSHLIAAGSEHDRFLMGLLRAFADVVLIGAGTLRASPHTRWTSERAYPPTAALFAELRRRRDRPPEPALAVVSGSGRIGAGHPGLEGTAIVLTSEQGAARLDGRLPRSAAIVPVGRGPALEPLPVVEALRAAGHRLILCEGGPTLFGALVAGGLVDELFLTLSPVLAGRCGEEERLALVEGTELLPGCSLSGTLLGVRRAGSHLFLRYRLPARA